MNNLSVNNELGGLHVDCRINIVHIMQLIDAYHASYINYISCIDTRAVVMLFDIPSDSTRHTRYSTRDKIYRFKNTSKTGGDAVVAVNVKTHSRCMIIKTMIDIMRAALDEIHI